MNILCFGDSNTHGQNPKDGSRHDRTVRYPAVLGTLLGSNYHIIEEGLSGRTIAFDDPDDKDRNGYKAIGVILKSHKPLDLITIMLGTNDTKTRFNASAEDIDLCMQRLIEKIRRILSFYGNDNAEILIINPPTIKAGISTVFPDISEDVSKTCKQIGILYEITANKYGAHFFDASKHAVFSDIDKLHLEADEHIKLAHALKDKILEISK